MFFQHSKKSPVTPVTRGTRVTARLLLALLLVAMPACNFQHPAAQEAATDARHP